MRIVYISLPTVGAVQDFVLQISPLEGNFDLLSGGYVLDAKSLMGIISLDLSKPLKLAVEKDTAEAMQAIRRFIVRTPCPNDVSVSRRKEIIGASEVDP